MAALSMKDLLEAQQRYAQAQKGPESVTVKDLKELLKEQPKKAPRESGRSDSSTFNKILSELKKQSGLIEKASSKIVQELKRNADILLSMSKATAKQQTVMPTREDQMESARTESRQLQLLEKIEENTREDKELAPVIKEEKKDTGFSLGELGTIATGLAVILGTLKGAFDAQIKTIKLFANAIADTGIAIKKLATGLYDALVKSIPDSVKKFFSDKIEKIGKSITTIIDNVKKSIADKLQPIGKFFADVVDKIKNIKIEDITKLVKDIFSKFKANLTKAFAVGVTYVKMIMDSIPDKFKAPFENIGKTFSSFANKFKTIFSQENFGKYFNEAIDMVKKTFDPDIFKAKISEIKDNAIKYVKTIFDDLTKGFDNLKTKTIQKLEPIVKVFDNIADFFKSFKTNSVDTVSDAFKSFKAIIGNFVKPFVEAFDVIKEITAGPVGKIKDIFNGIMDWAGKFSGVFGTVSKIASKILIPLNIIMTLWDTVKGAIEGFEKEGIVGGIKGAISGLINSLIMAPLDMLKSAVSWIVGAFGFEEAEKMLDSFSFQDLFSQFVDAVFSPIETVKKLFDTAVDFLQKIEIPKIAFTIPIINKEVSIGPFRPFGEEKAPEPSKETPKASEPPKVKEGKPTAEAQPNAAPGKPTAEAQPNAAPAKPTAEAQPAATPLKVGDINQETQQQVVDVLPDGSPVWGEQSDAKVVPTQKAVGTTSRDEVDVSEAEIIAAEEEHGTGLEQPVITPTVQPAKPSILADAKFESKKIAGPEAVQVEPAKPTIIPRDKSGLFPEGGLTKAPEPAEPAKLVAVKPEKAAPGQPQKRDKSGLFASEEAQKVVPEAPQGKKTFNELALFKADASLYDKYADYKLDLEDAGRDKLQKSPEWSSMSEDERIKALDAMKADAKSQAFAKFEKEITSAVGPENIKPVQPASTEALKEGQPQPTAAASVYQQSAEVQAAEKAPAAAPVIINAPQSTNVNQTSQFATRSPSRNTDSSYQQYNMSKFAF